MFGSNQLYVLHHPQDAAIQEKEGKVVEKVSFDTAQEEIITQSKLFDMDVKGKSAGTKYSCFFLIVYATNYGTSTPYVSKMLYFVVRIPKYDFY